jgi:hypothetical protein
MLRHRDAWADEKTAPTAERRASSATRRAPAAAAASAARDDAPTDEHPAAVPMDVLVVLEAQALRQGDLG